MTKQEAIDAIHQGKRVTHRLFSSDEFIYLDSDQNELRDENGYYLVFTEFWNIRQSPEWQTNWSIYE